MTEPTADFRPNWVSVPGDTIADLLDEKGWTQAEFAKRAGYTTKHANQLISGKASITEDTAFRLERVLGSSAQFWLNREAQYREALGRLKEQEKLTDSVDWLKEIPVKHMLEYEWIANRGTKVGLLSECLAFFGVASPKAWDETYGQVVESFAAFRASPTFEKKRGAVIAWLRQGERRAERIECAAFSRRKFEARLDELRALTNEADPGVFVPELTQACASVGVAVVFEAAPRGCPAAGATRWLAQNKALLMLSLRHKSNDHLWFAFFHEAAHLLYHGKKLLFLEGTGGMDEDAEQEANAFASETLIPKEYQRTLQYIGDDPGSVQSFANEIGVAPGIVVGRLQHEKLLPYKTGLNRLKVFYRWET